MHWFTAIRNFHNCSDVEFYKYKNMYICIFLFRPTKPWVATGRSAANRSLAMIEQNWFEYTMEMKKKIYEQHKQRSQPVARFRIHGRLKNPIITLIRHYQMYKKQKQQQQQKY